MDKKIISKSSVSILGSVTNMIKNLQASQEGTKSRTKSEKKIKTYTSDKIRRIVTRALEAVIEIDSKLENCGSTIRIPKTYKGLNETDMWSLKKHTENRFSERVRNIIQPISLIAQMFEMIRYPDKHPGLEVGAYRTLLKTDVTTLKQSTERLIALSAFADSLLAKHCSRKSGTT